MQSGTSDIWYWYIINFKLNGIDRLNYSWVVFYYNQMIICLYNDNKMSDLKAPLKKMCLQHRLSMQIVRL